MPESLSTAACRSRACSIGLRLGYLRVCPPCEMRVCRMFHTTLGSPTIPIPSHKSQHTTTNPYERWAPEIFGEFPLAAPYNLLYYQSGLALSSLQERKAHTGQHQPAVLRACLRRLQAATTSSSQPHPSVRKWRGGFLIVFLLSLCTCACQHLINVS